MTANKPFTRTEMKILIYNKMKNGMSYNEAMKEVNMEVGQVRENGKKEKHFFVKDDIIARKDMEDKRK